MKRLVFISVILVSVAAVSADTLNLIDPPGIPVPPESHVDQYLFPTSLLDTSNPITNLAIAYEGTFYPGRHEIVSATLLFDPADVESISNVSSGPTYYGASVKFSLPVMAVSDEFASAFWAVHSETGGPSLTELVWTALYVDGSQRVAVDGIIPEPSTAAVFVLSGLLLGARGCRDMVMPR